MRHRIANLLLALSLAVSIYVVEARVGSPAQADGLAGTDAATVAAVEPGSGAVGFGKSQADAAEPSGGPAGAGAESVSESGPGQGAKPSAGSAAAGTPASPAKPPPSRDRISRPRRMKPAPGWWTAWPKAFAAAAPSSG